MLFGRFSGVFGPFAEVYWLFAVVYWPFAEVYWPFAEVYWRFSLLSYGFALSFYSFSVVFWLFSEVFWQGFLVYYGWYLVFYGWYWVFYGWELVYHFSRENSWIFSTEFEDRFRYLLEDSQNRDDNIGFFEKDVPHFESVAHLKTILNPYKYLSSVYYYGWYLVYYFSRENSWIFSTFFWKDVPHFASVAHLKTILNPYKYLSSVYYCGWYFVYYGWDLVFYFSRENSWIFSTFFWKDAPHFASVAHLKTILNPSKFLSSV